MNLYFFGVDTMNSRFLSLDWVVSSIALIDSFWTGYMDKWSENLPKKSNSFECKKSQTWLKKRYIPKLK